MVGQPKFGSAKTPIEWVTKSEINPLTPITVGATGSTVGMPFRSIVLGKERQSILGFGASLTDSAAYLINEVLTPSQRQKWLTRFFDTHNGIGLSVLRNPMGACDYSRYVYSYDDIPKGSEDPRLKHFSLEHDERDIIPLIHRIQKLSSDLFLICSPWSAPAWMKTSNSMKAGQLKPNFYSVYADYFTKFITGYKRHGIHVDAVTPQNEPLYEPTHYPSMRMSAEQEARFIHSHLRPALRKAGLQTKIFVYDHNWDRPDYPLEVLQRVCDDVDGVAWHWYAGEAYSQAIVTKYYPTVSVYCTEASGGSWIPGFQPAFNHLVDQIISALHFGARTFILWNLALDSNNGPTIPNFGRSTCRGMITVNPVNRSAQPTLDFYGIAHFSRVIKPGAYVLETNQVIPNVAVRNPDGSLGAVLLNKTKRDINVRLKRGTKSLILSLPAAATCSVLVPQS